MMKKDSFINRFYFCSENYMLPIYDKLVLAERSHKVVYTGEFCTPNIWGALQDLNEEIGLNIYSYGIFEDAERKMMAFSEESVECSYPVKLLEIICKSKFTKLSHKDYLGSLMSLGIKREKFGDLILNGNGLCYLAVCEDISDYVKMNLNSVGRCPCEVGDIDIHTEEIPNYNFKTYTLNVSSLRIDCMVSSLCNLSRSKSEEIIRQGKVLLDYLPVDKKDRLVKEYCTITVSGCGKFKIAGKRRFTGTGRYKLLVKKFS
ncbi:YlmH family RNA-binding protein [Clostridium sp. HV4-5-A1G]|uniref:YlmH family RNA-binding protein n=1 Tax=Clostridium sp. HV4-5-A1G TaxID=2004595 RepID=UPI001F45F1C3|nr:YlmH/Sll1252 family protein [Clostridium sp. HV4-5-A1G]